MVSESFVQKSFRAGLVFTPGSPVKEIDLFSGRSGQISRVVDAISQRGYHAIVFGERGVGKTSLANVLSSSIRAEGATVLLPRVNCTATDNFSTIWRKVFHEIVVTEKREMAGFYGAHEEVVKRAVDDLPKRVAPDDVRRTLATLSEGIILAPIFDEFDRLEDADCKALMADTIKMLSDFAVDTTVILIGVADSIDELISAHQSVERGLIQVPMPRMSPEEVRDIMRRGLIKLGMSVDVGALNEIVQFSQGLPYVTHLLSLASCKAALGDEMLEINIEHVDKGIFDALDQWQHTSKSTYYNATKSPQPGHMYREVLLACALTPTDDFGYFAAADVRKPLKAITGKNYDVPNFARHLKQLSSHGRGSMLSLSGSPRRQRYRFVGPLMRPYIILRSFADGLMSRKEMQRLFAGI